VEVVLEVSRVVMMMDMVEEQLVHIELELHQFQHHKQ
jgi:hypothetical protein